jgi:hypothetical protein
MKKSLFLIAALLAHHTAYADVRVGQYLRSRTYSAAATIPATSDAVLANATSAAFTLTLPSATASPEKVLTIKKIDATVNYVTVSAAGSQTIDGISTYALAAPGAYLTLLSDGSNWRIIQSKNPWKVDANIGGANPTLTVSNIATYTEITDAGLDMVQNSGSVAVQIPCSTTNSSSGLTCSAGSESLGVVFTMPSAGSVMACVSFSHNYGGGAGDTGFEVVETPNNAQTITQESNSRIMSGTNNASGFTSPYRLCGVLTFSTVGQKTLRLMREQSFPSGTINLVIADRSGSVGQRDIHWEVYPLN